MTQIKTKHCVLGASRGVGGRLRSGLRRRGRVLAVPAAGTTATPGHGDAPGIDMLALDPSAEEAPARVPQQ